MTRRLLLPLALLCFLSTSAQHFQQEYGNPRKPFLETIATPDHADSRYCLGQTATLRLVARTGGVPLEGVTVRYRCGREMLLPDRQDSTVFHDGEALIRMGTMGEPGFLACQYEFMADGKRQADLVKVAYEPERITSLTPMPDDFERFWSKAVSEARKVDLEPEYFDVPDATTDDIETKLVRLHVGPGKWMQGYLSRPRDGRRHPVVLVPPGAGSQRIFPSDYFPRRGYVYLKIEIHDIDQRLSDSDYSRARQKADGYERRGIASRDTYYYKDVYTGCVRAVDFLCSLPDWDGRNVIVTGGSQGGALTIVTAALNPRVTLCAPFYPALCDLTGFLHQRAGGWPKFFAQAGKGGLPVNVFSRDANGEVTNDEAAATLQYFDVVNFARLLKVPTFMSWGYSDDTCSPTSVWAAWNAISAPKTSDITPTSGHWRFASSQEKCLVWMKSHLKNE